MKFWTHLRCLVSGILHRSQMEREMDEELRGHIQARADDLERSGLPRAEAERRARLEFGSLEHTKQQVRSASAGFWLETLLQDLRFGARMLRKSPGFTAVAVLTLALGIGANTAVFSVVNAALLRPLPFRDSERLVRVQQMLPTLSGFMAVSVPDFKDWQQQNDLFEGLAAYEFASFTLLGAPNPDRVPGMYVTPDFFDVMGLPPVLGRGFLSGEDVRGANHVVVLSNALWRSRFGGNPSVVGQPIRLNSETFRIVGVMPSEIRFAFPDAQLWVPLVPTAEQEALRGTHFLQVIGRLRAGVPTSTAETQMTSIMARIAEQYSNGTAGPARVQGLKESSVQNVRDGLLILPAAVALVFLVACANVLSLFLEKAAERQNEVSIRTALGATRGRLLRQFLLESLVLALLAGGLAWIFALGGTSFLSMIRPQDLGGVQTIRPDLRVLGFTSVLSIIAALVLCLGTVLQRSKMTLRDSLKENSVNVTASRRQGRARGVLVTVQFAAALALVLGAVLLVKSLHRLLLVDSGLQPRRVLTMRISLPANKYSQGHTETAFYQPMLAGVENLAGVETAGLISHLPIQLAGTNGSFEIEGQPASSPREHPTAEIRAVSPGYFRALGIPLLRGRYFADRDDLAGPPALLVNQALVDRYFPDEDPIGKRLHFDLGPNQPRAWLPIVGVVGNVTQFGLAEPPRPEIDFSYLQVPAFGPLARTYLIQTMSLVVQTTGEPLATASAVRETVLRLDPEQPVFNIQTMEEVISASIGDRRFYTWLVAAFAVLGLLVAVLGIYGAMNYAVRLRTHEMAIRLALGAQRTQVVGMVVGEGMKLVLVGVVLGIAGALALTRLLSSLLYGVEPTDPATFVTVTLVLLGTALAACYIPARRATRVDPAVTLRYE